MIAEAIEAVQMEQPSTVIGLAAVVLVQLLITAGGAWHTWISQRRTRDRQMSIKGDVASIKGDVVEVKHHTVNDHGDRNLRGDIDRLLEIGEDNQRLGEENQTAVAELRGEVKGLTHRVDQITRPTIVRPAPRTGW